MRPYAKKNRSVIACNTCRSSKVKCIKDPKYEKCERCHILNVDCVYLVKKSQQSGIISTKIKNIHTSPKISSGDAISGTLIDHKVILPEKRYIIEVADIFFNNQYQGIFPFIHRPSFLEFLNSDEFNPSTYFQQYRDRLNVPSFSASVKYPDPVLILSILALCARLHPKLSSFYGRFSETESPEKFQPEFSTDTSERNFNAEHVCASNASKYFGWNARRFMMHVFDSPTVQRIQAFTLLSSHEWGECNNSRSFLYIGIAARMALVLGLGNENSICNIEEDHYKDENEKEIAIESRRRTIWSVYMMDRCNSSGRERSPAIKIEDIKIKLPSSENDFLFGNTNKSPTFLELTKELSNDEYSKFNNLSLCGFTIYLFELWAKVAKWTGEVGAKNEKVSPWLSNSTFDNLRNSLDKLESKLPKNYRFSNFNLNIHMESGSATHFGYFHGLLFLCRIFLNREYLFCNPHSFPKHWWQNSIKKLLESLEGIASIMDKLGEKQMVVIAPFTGFEVFSTAVTSLYFCAFPSEILLEYFPRDSSKSGGSLEDIETWKYKYKSLALKSLDSLLIWTRVWELGRNWHLLSIQLGILFGQLTENESNSFNTDHLRQSMQDYGSGKVSEVYTPTVTLKSSQENEMVISRILNRDTTTPATNPSGRVDSINASSSNIIQNFGGLEFLSPPQISLGESTASPSIFPGWYEAQNLHEF